MEKLDLDAFVEYVTDNQYVAESFKNHLLMYVEFYRSEKERSPSMAQVNGPKKG